MLKNDLPVVVILQCQRCSVALGLLRERCEPSTRQPRSSTFDEVVLETDVNLFHRHTLQNVAILVISDLSSTHKSAWDVGLTWGKVAAARTKHCVSELEKGKKKKTTAPRIPAWSPTVVLTERHSG